MADNSLLEKVLGLQEKYEALQAQLSDPEVIGDMKRFVQLNKEYKELTPIIEAGLEFKRILENYEMAKEILATEKDEDLREMAKEEIAEIEPTLPEWEERIKQINLHRNYLIQEKVERLFSRLFNRDLMMNRLMKI